MKPGPMTQELWELEEALNEAHDERDLALKMRDAAREASARDLELRRGAQAEATRLQAIIDAWRNS